MGMIDTIKKAGLSAFESTNPTNILFGEILTFVTEKDIIKSTYPSYVYNPKKYSIRIDQKLVLDERFFIFPESLKRYEIDLKHTHDYIDDSCSGGLSSVTAHNKITKESLTEVVVVREGLKVGDKVLLLRVQGGQQFIVLDKVIKEL